MDRFLFSIKATLCCCAEETCDEQTEATLLFRLVGNPAGFMGLEMQPGIQLEEIYGLDEAGWTRKPTVLSPHRYGVFCGKHSAEND